MTPQLGKLLMVGGLILSLLGLVIYILSKNGWLNWVGKLPGDIRHEGESSSFHFPIITCIVISIILSIIMNLFRR